MSRIESDVFFVILGRSRNLLTEDMKLFSVHSSDVEHRHSDVDSRLSPNFSPAPKNPFLYPSDVDDEQPEDLQEDFPDKDLYQDRNLHREDEFESETVDEFVDTNSTVESIPENTFQHPAKLSVLASGDETGQFPESIVDLSKFPTKNDL